MNFLPLARKTDHLYFKPLKQFLKNALSLSFLFFSLTSQLTSFSRKFKTSKLTIKSLLIKFFNNHIVDYPI